MNRKLIIEGNAVYELDENCMLKKRLDTQENVDVRTKEKRKEKRIKKETE